MSEVRYLIARGVKEINLIAQDTTYYGMDLYGEEKLADLLEMIAGEDIQWIRVLYCYPGRITQKLLDTIALHHNICHYLDIPLQHVDRRILKRMGRKENREFLEDLIFRIRRTVPDIAFDNFMVGFRRNGGGVSNLADFVGTRILMVRGFYIFPRRRYPAALLPDQISEDVKQDRSHRLMALVISWKRKKVDY